MAVEQISVFIENRKGRLAEMTRILGENAVNMRALFVADTADYGIARIIVDQTDKAIEALKANGYTVNKTNVLAVEIPDEPGGLARVLDPLNEADLNIEYLYCFAEQGRDKAIGVLRIEEVGKAEEVLKSSGMRVLEAKEVP